MISDGNAWFTSGGNPNLFYVSGQACDLEELVTDFCGVPWLDNAGWMFEQNSVTLSENPVDADGYPLAEHCAALNAGSPVNLLYLDNPAPDTNYTITNSWKLPISELPGATATPHRGAIECPDVGE